MRADGQTERTKIIVALKRCENIKFYINMHTLPQIISWTILTLKAGLEIALFHVTLNKADVDRPTKNKML
jgi:hypothetical protein